MGDQDGGLSFPNEPRSELDRALADVLRSAEKVMETQGRLRSLLAATRSVSEGLELPDLLRRIVHAAMTLVGARYGALGVIAADGALEEFVHEGMAPEEVDRIGHLPEGRGLLGALIENPHPIRLEHLHDDARSSGFPANHPAMDSFLGVPIRVRGETFGNLYLTERKEGAFTEEDEELLAALASAAGVAIENARLYEEAQRRQGWAQASAEFSSVLLRGDVDGALALLADRCVRIAEAALVCIVLPDADELRVHVARGPLASTVEGLRFPRTGTLASEAIHTARVVIDAAASHRTLPTGTILGPAMALPLSSRATGAFGAITVARAQHGLRFTEEDIAMAAQFADQASIALELARSLLDRQRLELLDERGRIARDLHDHVIQRLFATGMSLQGTATLTSDSHVADRVAEAADEVDRAVADIRTAIFAMNVRGVPALRTRVLELVNEYAEPLGFSPRLTFAGPIDLLADEALADDAVAVIREGLSNALRHAEAQSIDVHLDGTDGTLAVVIRDDGAGIDAAHARSSGLRNLETRAASRGGTFSARRLSPHGTELRWAVPARLDEESAVPQDERAAR